MRSGGGGWRTNSTSDFPHVPNEATLRQRTILVLDRRALFTGHYGPTMVYTVPHTPTALLSLQLLCG